MTQSWNTLPTLRDYQIRVKDEVYEFVKQGKRRVLVCAATGAGKTMIAAAIAYDYVKHLNKKILFIGHRTALVNQTTRTMGMWGLTCGVVAGGYPEDRSRSVQVALFQSLSIEEGEDRRTLESLLSWFTPDIIIVDEAHVTSFSAIALQLTPRLEDVKQPESWLTIGLTATPDRSSPYECMGDIYECMAIAPQPQELIEMGALVPFTYYDVPKSGKGRLDAQVEFIIRSWQKFSQGDDTIAFCPSVRATKELNEAFIEIGIKSAIVIDRTSNKKREEIYESFRSEAKDKIKVICSCDALTEGFDATNARVGIFWRFTQSWARGVQMMGRLARRHQYSDGTFKKDAIALDCCGFFDEGGIPYFEEIEVTPDFLYNKEVKPSGGSGEFPKKKCPIELGGCGAHVFPGLRVCPKCDRPFDIVGMKKWEPNQDMKLVITREKQGIAIASYRALVIEAYHKDFSPQWAVDQYFNKYKHYPLPSWETGAVTSSGVTQAEYKSYLCRHSRRGIKGDQLSLPIVL